MIATRSQSVSASSIACVVSSTVTPRSRRARARGPRWWRARAGPCPRSARRGTRRGAGRRARTRARAAAPGRRRGAARACPTVSRRPDEVEQRFGRLRRLVVGREQPQQLERAAARGTARPTAASRRSAGAGAGRRAPGRGPSTRTVPGVGPAVALEDLDGRGLARAVGSEQPEHLAGADLEVELVDRARRPVRLAERGDGDRRVGRCSPLRSPATRRTPRARRASARAVSDSRRAPRARRAPRRRAGRSRPRRRRARRCARTAPAARRRRMRSGRPSRAARAGHGRARSRARSAIAMSGVGLPSRRSSPTGLPVTAVSPNAPSTSSRSWNASPIGSPIAESGAGELGVAAGERGAEVQRPFDGVLARLVRRDAARGRGVGARGRGADEVERLADAELDAQLVEDRLRGVGRAAQQHVGVHEREVADEDRHAVAEAAGRARATIASSCWRANWRCTASRPRRISEPSMMSSCTSANVCTSSSAAAASITA